MLPDKSAVVAALNAQTRASLAGVEAVAEAARKDVGSDETRQEGKYDTRSTEASYLARGQAWRVAELRRLVAWYEAFQASPLDVVQVGALVLLEGDDAVFLAPVGGGSVQVDDRTIRIVSPSSPMGAALADLEAGDVLQFESPRGRVELEVIAVR